MLKFLKPLAFSRQLHNAVAPSATKQLANLTPLKFEKDLYATIRVHNRPYMVTEGDKVFLPFRMKHAEIGDTLTFNDVISIGSRNYIFAGEPIDPQLFSIKATVIEKTKQPYYVKEVTKRRQRHVRHIPVKHDLTVLRVSELRLV